MMESFRYAGMRYAITLVSHATVCNRSTEIKLYTSVLRSVRAVKPLRRKLSIAMDEIPPGVRFETFAPDKWERTQ